MADYLSNIKKVKLGKTERYSFGRVENILPIQDLLELPKNSFKRFLEKGIGDILNEFSPIMDFSGKAYLTFVDYHVDLNPRFSKQECKRKGITYSVPLKVKVRLVITETGEAREQEVFLGDIPLMTEDGSFVSNGSEKVVVNQIVRSPGAYYDGEIDKTGKELFSATLIPLRGTWLELEQSSADMLKLVLDRSSKVTIVTFLKCFGLSNAEIEKYFGDNAIIKGLLEKEELKTQEECLIELARRMRPNDIPDANATRKFLSDIFFTQQYNLAEVGRYKVNKKFYLPTRIKGMTCASNITVNRKVLVKAGEVITYEKAVELVNQGVNIVDVVVDGKAHRVIGNSQVFAHEIIGCDAKELEVRTSVYYPNLAEILSNATTKEEMISRVNDNVEKLCITHLTMEDILAMVSYHLDLDAGFGYKDDIDNLANRRVCPAGELLQNAFRSGVIKLVTSAKETMQSQDMENLMPSQVMNARHVNKELKTFISSSQLCQLMDQVNPISGLAQKRKLSSVGPGGIKKERASAEVRDIHYTQYGRICAVETPEGQGVGLVTNLALYAKVNDFGFIETPYRKVVDRKVTDEVVYMTADEEAGYYMGQATEPLDENGCIKNDIVIARKDEDIVEISSSKINFVDTAPNQIISITTSLIPFVEKNEAARAAFGTNMERQAVPLLKTEAPIVATGMEYYVARDSGAMVRAKRDGVVEYVDADCVKVRADNGELDTYTLIKHYKSNQETCYNQRPSVNDGDRVSTGDLIADGFSTHNGELALGRNVLVAYLNWEGYNYEDAIIISERMAKDDVYTSITLKVEEVKARSIRLGDEEITRDIPNLGEEALKNLDERGIVRVGAEVQPGDILVGKTTPKGETELTPEERLLRAIFGEKAREVKDTSLRVQHGHGGVVVDVQVFSRKNKDDLEAGVNMMVKVIVAQKRKISVGDKMAGRYGDKGVVSKVVRTEDMPFLANGQPIDIILTPLGIPSRNNLGQLFETHLGLVAKSLGWNVMTPCFDGATEEQIQQLLRENNLPEDGKMTLYDGRTGLPFDNRVTVGYRYMIKLDHMVDSKMHARSTGPYALVTQQPLGGKAMFGGQRFGEMEVWALEAYGASHILQEMLTVKSDDINGRQKTYEAIVQGKPIGEPGIPEAFKVLVKEMQALGLDITVLNDEKQEITLNDLSIEEHEMILPKEEEHLSDIELELDDTTLSENGDVYPTDEQLNTEDFDEDLVFDLE